MSIALPLPETSRSQALPAPNSRLRALREHTESTPTLTISGVRAPGECAEPVVVSTQPERRVRTEKANATQRAPRGSKPQVVRLQERDMFVLDFLTMFRVASPGLLAYAMSNESFASNAHAIYKRCNDLVRAGYLERYYPPNRAQPVYLVTRKGASVSSHPDVAVSTFGNIESSLAHAHLMSAVAAAFISGKNFSDWGLDGSETLVSEYAIKRAVARLGSVPSWSDVHEGFDFLACPEYLAVPTAPGLQKIGYLVPDLVFAHPSGVLTAIEVETAVKSQESYDEILKNYALAPHRTVYLVGNTRTDRPVLETVKTRLAKAEQKLRTLPRSTLSLVVQDAPMQWASSNYVREEHS